MTISPGLHERQLVLFRDGWVDLHRIILVVDLASLRIYFFIIGLDDRMATCTHSGRVTTHQQKNETKLGGEGRTIRIGNEMV